MSSMLWSVSPRLRPNTAYVVRLLTVDSAYPSPDAIAFDDTAPASQPYPDGRVSVFPVAVTFTVAAHLTLSARFPRKTASTIVAPIE